MSAPSRADCAARDGSDPFADKRSLFALPDGVIYLDGNSLGALPEAVPARLDTVARSQWGRDLITGWSKGWMELPVRLGARIAPLIGARDDEVLAADSTSVNLYKLAAAALDARPGRRKILTQRDNFPTDLYMLEAVAKERGAELSRVPEGEFLDALDDSVALVVLTHVHYKTAAIWDMAAVCAAARAADALSLWDLAHSAGAVPLDLDGAGADLAVGCGYKFLNGGPGAPAFLHVARRLQDTLSTPLAGWMGHAEPLSFAADYTPAPGIARFACGTPPILGLSALDAALDAFDGVDTDALYAKAQALGDLFIGLTEGLPGLSLISPRDAERRGSQVAFAHPQAGAIMARLIARGVIGDHRPPDVLRFGLAPLYNRFADIFDAAAILAEEVRATETALSD